MRMCMVCMRFKLGHSMSNFVIKQFNDNSLIFVPFFHFEFRKVQFCTLFLGTWVCPYGGHSANLKWMKNIVLYRWSQRITRSWKRFYKGGLPTSTFERFKVLVTTQRGQSYQCPTLCMYHVNLGDSITKCLNHFSTIEPIIWRVIWIQMKVFNRWWIYELLG